MSPAQTGAGGDAGGGTSGRPSGCTTTPRGSAPASWRSSAAGCGELTGREAQCSASSGTTKQGGAGRRRRLWVSCRCRRWAPGSPARAAVETSCPWWCDHSVWACVWGQAAAAHWAGSNSAAQPAARRTCGGHAACELDHRPAGSGRGAGACAHQEGGCCPCCMFGAGQQSNGAPNARSRTRVDCNCHRSTSPQRLGPHKRGQPPVQLVSSCPSARPSLHKPSSRHTQQQQRRPWRQLCHAAARHHHRSGWRHAYRHRRHSPPSLAAASTLAEPPPTARQRRPLRRRRRPWSSRRLRRQRQRSRVR